MLETCQMLMHKAGSLMAMLCDFRTLLQCISVAKFGCASTPDCCGGQCQKADAADPNGSCQSVSGKGASWQLGMAQMMPLLLMACARTSFALAVYCRGQVWLQSLSGLLSWQPLPERRCSGRRRGVRHGELALALRLKGVRVCLVQPCPRLTAPPPHLPTCSCPTVRGRLKVWL